MEKHEGVHNLKSSWVLCVNLYFPFRVSADGKSLFASFLKHYVAADIDSLETIELEYAGEGELHPSRLLGEEGGTRGANQTSPDLGLVVNEGRGLVHLSRSRIHWDKYMSSELAMLRRIRRHNRSSGR